MDIIVFYSNNKEYLNRTINSLLKQKDVNNSNNNIIIAKSKSMPLHLSDLDKYKKKFCNIIISDEPSLVKSEILNAATKYVKSEYMLIIDEFQALKEDAINKLLLKKKSLPNDIAIYEMRMIPYESIKDYDPLNFETEYFIDSCYLIKKSVFDSISGFDKNLSFLEKNVDLCLRIQNLGYKIVYISEAVTYNFKELPFDFDTLSRYTFNFINNYYLRCKYGTHLDRKEWRQHFIKTMLLVNKNNVIIGRKYVMKEMLKAFLKSFIIKYGRIKNGKTNANIKIDFKLDSYGIVKHKNNLYQHVELKSNPLVSVLIRTCGRPNVLRETLISIRNQTYKNIEVVIVEDGPNISESMLKNEFTDLNIVYEASGAKVGRCIVGNRAMELAKGKYLNFLDDDDLFYNDHVEVMVSQLENNPSYHVAHDFALQTNIKIDSTEPYKYTVLKKYLFYNRKFNRAFIWIVNSFPTQALMFKKEVFLQCGGFDTEMDHMEDWELWTRFSIRNPFLVVEKITSIYRIVPDPQKIKPRQELMEKYTPIAQHKIYNNSLDGLKVLDFIEDIQKIADYRDMFF